MQSVFQSLNNKKGIKFISFLYNNYLKRSRPEPMSCHKCNTIKDRRIPAQRQRYIPTFAHKDIFNYEPVEYNDLKCSPTFHSTVLNTDGYQIKTIHDKPKHYSRPVTASVLGGSKVTYQNQTQQKRVHALSPHCCASHAEDTVRQVEEEAADNEQMAQSQHQNFTRNDEAGRNLSVSRRDNWFDHTKEDILGSLGDCRAHGYSRERKIINLSSDPVFTDYRYGKNTQQKAWQSSRVNKRNQDKCQNPNCQCGTDCRCADCFKQCPPSQLEVCRNCGPKCLCGPNCSCADNCQCCSSVVAQGQQQNAPELVVTPGVCQCGANCKCQDCPQDCAGKVQSTKNADKAENLKVKGNKVVKRPDSAKRTKVVSEKPTFTVVRKSRVGHKN